MTDTVKRIWGNINSNKTKAKKTDEGVSSSVLKRVTLLLSTGQIEKNTPKLRPDRRYILPSEPLTRGLSKGALEALKQALLGLSWIKNLKLHFQILKGAFMCVLTEAKHYFKSMYIIYDNPFSLWKKRYFLNQFFVKGQIYIQTFCNVIGWQRLFTRLFP